MHLSPSLTIIFKLLFLSSISHPPYHLGTAQLFFFPPENVTNYSVCVHVLYICCVCVYVFLARLVPASQPFESLVPKTLYE